MDAAEVRHRILVVDDSRTVIEVIRVYLMGSGYEFRIAADGASGFELAVREPPDLVISDYKMPILGGIQLCRKLRRLQVTQRVPFLLITSSLTDDLEDEARSAGVTRCFKKPVDGPALAQVVTQLLAHRDTRA